MRKAGTTFILAVAAILAFADSAYGQTKDRWRLLYEQDKPQIYTHRDPLDHRANYWYFTYTITNVGDEVVPILTDLMMYVEVGKDLQNDVRKVDPDPTKSTHDDVTKSENLKFGRFVSNVLVPKDVEYKIIAYHAKIGNRSDGIINESIEEFKKGFVEEPAAEWKGQWSKGDRWYLNPRELRQQRHIKPGQRIMAMAIFRDVDPRARRIEVHVSGLYDIFRVEQYTEDETKLVYENRVLKKAYEYPGDEFEREKDVLYERKSEWVIKPIGPVASKETLASLVNSLVTRLKLEEGWEKESVAAPERDVLRAKENLNSLDMNIAGRIIQQSSGVNFGFDSEKTTLENQASIWRIHEWWLKFKSKLVFNDATGRFEVKDDLLPGEQRDPK
jgi:hypothetical protein